MRLALLANDDHSLLEDDPGRAAREDVQRVAEALTNALRASGHEVETIGVGSDPLAFVPLLRRFKPDLVVNLCESVAADSRGEALIPSILELLDLPYTGSGSLALDLALHKNFAKDMLRARGVPTPRSCLVSSIDELAQVDVPMPVIVKPVREDASTGIDSESVVKDLAGLERAVRRVFERFSQPALVEQYIEGREIYVPLLGNSPRRVLKPTEIVFGPAFENRPRIVDYDAKWNPESESWKNTGVALCELDPQTLERVVDVAKAAFEALGCRDYGRVDLRLGEDGVPYVIEVNPNCDLHPEAGFARAALASGLAYVELADALVSIAAERCERLIHAGDPPPVVDGSRAVEQAPYLYRGVHA